MRGKGQGSDETLTLDEWRAHWRLSDWGKKTQIEDPVQSKANFNARLDALRGRLHAHSKAGGKCPCCEQVLPANWPQQSVAELVALGVVDLA